MKKVSIVVPVYNMGSKIEICVGSLREQTYSSIEIILVDDGSKDDSFVKCQELQNKYSRIRVFHTVNQGSGAARNYGIEKADGDYIYFPDADDYLEPNAIEILVQTMERTNSDLVVFGYKNVNNKGQLISTKTYQTSNHDAAAARKDYSNYYGMDMPWSIQGAPWNKFFKLSLIKENSIEYPALRRHQDDAFIARYVAHIQEIAYISDVLYTYYVSDLNHEWDKYPKDYIDAVIGLYEDRKINLLRWNNDDKKIHELILGEYICNVIKALELSFSPKFGFINKRERLAWMDSQITRSGILKNKLPKCLPMYQRFTIFLIKKVKSSFYYHFLHFKVLLEKQNFLPIIKKFYELFR
jgi:glycosyltransferase involved in cell wall biosynthesis